MKESDGHLLNSSSLPPASMECSSALIANCSCDDQQLSTYAAQKGKVQVMQLVSACSFAGVNGKLEFVKT